MIDGALMSGASLMKFKAYDLISRAVDEGVERGMARAYKHIDRPARDEIITVIQDEVMASLSEIIEWELPE